MSGLSVVVCTRNRPEWCRQVTECVAMQLQQDDELIVVDQSDDDFTGEAIGHMQSRGRMRHLRSARRGLSAARNEAMQAAVNDLLVFTDDDCLPADDWIERWREVWSGWNMVVGIAFGRVRLPPFDATQGYIGGFEPEDGIHDRTVFRGSSGAVGIGANVSVRRPLALAVGGFDEVLGSGAHFGAGEELDLAYRILRSGHLLAHTRAASVWHHGYRPNANARTLVQRYRYGTAAAFAKHMRCGDTFGAAVLARDVWTFTWQIATQALHRRRPLGLRGLRAYLAGIGAGFIEPVDARSRLYVNRNRAPAPENPAVAELTRI